MIEKAWCTCCKHTDHTRGSWLYCRWLICVCHRWNGPGWWNLPRQDHLLELNPRPWKKTRITLCPSAIHKNIFMHIDITNNNTSVSLKWVPPNASAVSLTNYHFFVDSRENRPCGLAGCSPPLVSRLGSHGHCWKTMLYMVRSRVKVDKVIMMVLTPRFTQPASGLGDFWQSLYVVKKTQIHSLIISTSQLSPPRPRSPQELVAPIGGLAVRHCCPWWNGHGSLASRFVSGATALQSWLDPQNPVKSWESMSTHCTIQSVEIPWVNTILVGGFVPLKNLLVNQPTIPKYTRKLFKATNHHPSW